MDTNTHVCKRCGYQATTKGSLVRHLKSKKPCVVTVEDIVRDELILELMKREYKTSVVTCEHCSKTVSKPVYKRHKDTCQQKQVPSACNGQEVSKDEFLALKAELFALKRHVEQVGSTTGTLVNNGVINNTTLVININNFGQEDISYLSPELLIYCMKNPKKGIKKLIEQIHYNEEYPENHNLRCKSLKQNLFEKYEDAQWSLCDASNTLDELIKKGWRILETHLAQQLLSEPDIYSDEQRLNDLQRFRDVLGDNTCQDYFAVKRDLRLLIKDKTMYVLERVQIPISAVDA